MQLAHGSCPYSRPFIDDNELYTRKLSRTLARYESRKTLLQILSRQPRFQPILMMPIVCLVAHLVDFITDVAAVGDSSDGMVKRW
ncbi:hypothetical protein IPL68_08005 [Candidatus Saccharibacteria bacterium]|nr:MAG: hypothetical protein IPL68_08005 [Candidatus Saccharibacteria bacterium]